MISGYATLRMRAITRPSTSTVSGLEDNQIFGTFENTSETNFTVQMRQTSDESVSGTRTDVGSAHALVPGGRVTETFSPFQTFLEAYCTADGPGFLRLQMQSRIKWEIMAFDKSDTFYPQQLRDVSPIEDI